MLFGIVSYATTAIKKFLRQKDQVILQSANPKYDDIIIKETDQFVISGVVLRIVDGSV